MKPGRCATPWKTMVPIADVICDADRIKYKVSIPNVLSSAPMEIKRLQIDTKMLKKCSCGVWIILPRMENIKQSKVSWA